MAEQVKSKLTSSRKTLNWLPIWVALAGFLLYANTIGNDYALDDGVVVAGNPYVQQGIKGIPGVFTTDMWHFESVELGYYRPLSLVTFAIENQFFHNNPHVSHCVNALLYALTGFILCLLLMRILSTYTALFSFAIALLFMAHPVHSEVVANIKSRDEILALLNLLFSLWLLLRSAEKQWNWKWLISSLLFFYLALLSKETAAAGLILIPIALYFTYSFSLKQMVKATVPFLALVVIFQLQKYWVIGSVVGADNNDIVSFPYADTGSKLATAFLHLAYYVKLIFIPYPLSYNYAYNQIPAADWSSVGTIAGVVIAGALIFFSFRNLKSKSPLALGVFIFATLLMPAMGFVILKGGILAERFLYAPALGFCIAIAWLGFKVLNLRLKSDFTVTENQRVKWLPFAGVFLLYSFTTVSRNMDWKNDLTLSAHDVHATINSCQVHLHYGKKLIDDGVAEKDSVLKRVDFNEGAAQLLEAIRINPHYARAYFKMAYAYQSLEENDDSAIFYYTRAIDEAPGYSLAYNNLGTLYAKMGRMQLATHYLKKALEINPQLLSASQLLQRLNQVAPPANTVVGNSSSTFESYSNLGVKYARQKDFVNAQKYMLLAIQLKPASAEARVNLAVCYSMMKEYDKSMQLLNEALKIDPNNKSALKNMAALYHMLGNKAKEEEYRVKLTKAEASKGL